MAANHMHALASAMFDKLGKQGTVRYTLDMLNMRKAHMPNWTNRSTCLLTPELPHGSNELKLLNVVRNTCVYFILSPFGQAREAGNFLAIHIGSVLNNAKTTAPQRAQQMLTLASFLVAPLLKLIWKCWAWQTQACMCLRHSFSS